MSLLVLSNGEKFQWKFQRASVINCFYEKLSHYSRSMYHSTKSIGVPNNYVHLAPFLKYIQILLENRRFWPPNQHLAPPLGWPHSNFAEMFRVEKNSPWAILRIVVYVMLIIAVLTKCRLVTDGRRDRRTDEHSMCCSRTASHSKKTKHYWTRNLSSHTTCSPISAAVAQRPQQHTSLAAMQSWPFL